MKRRFQKGDVVRLRSGGPSMTVRKQKDGTVVCDWAEGETMRRDSFYIEQLVGLDRTPDDMEIARKVATLLQETLAGSDHPSSENDHPPFGSAPDEPVVAMPHAEAAKE